jgi:hypothetical protein
LPPGGRRLGAAARGVQDGYLGRRQARRRRARGRGGATSRAALYQGYDLVALFGLDVAQLILDVNTVLAAQVEQYLALHVQFAGQNV